MSVINISELVGKLIHSPILYTDTDEIPMYVKVKEKPHDVKYMENMSKTYNSPNNIRRIFLTYSGVTINWYVPYVENKRQLRTYTKNFHFNTSIDSTASDILKAGLNGEVDEQSKLVGSPISLLNNLYECSNVEEIYFDWTYALADGCIDSIKEIANENALDKYEFINSIRYAQKFSEINTDHFRNIVDETLGENWKERFPRLHQVGIISNLEAVMSNPAVINSQGLLKTKNDTKTWLESNAELIQRSNSIVQISIIDQSSKPNYNFKVKDQQYKFDHDYLKDYVEKYKKAFENIIRTGNAEGVKEEPKEETSGEIDETLEALITELRETEKKRGIQNYAMAILRIAYCDMSADEKKKAINSVSGENKQLLSKAIL